MFFINILFVKLFKFCINRKLNNRYIHTNELKMTYFDRSNTLKVKSITLVAIDIFKI
jgi:hypothetical protein